MTFLPIVERELRTASRRKSTYRTRLGSALAAICLTTWLLLTMDSLGGSPGMLSKSIFGTLTTIAFVYCLLAGVRNTADCLSEEKREGTLGLLFLTDLKGYDVVLGKLIATSLNSFYGLLAIFPVLAIPLLLGGVTASQFWLTVLCLANTLFFSLAAGMFVSAISRHERRAMSGTFLVILFFTAGLPLIYGMLHLYFKPTIMKGAEIAGWLKWFSPGYAFGLTYGFAFTPTGRLEFWYSNLTMHLVGWALLVAGSYRLPRAWQDKPSTAKASRWRENWTRWNYGKAEQRAAFRQRLLNANPYLWLASRDHLKSAYLWTFLIGVASVWGWVCSESGWRSSDWVSWAFTAILLLHTAMKIWFASEAGHQLGTDRHSGALELVLSTPLRVEEILRGQWLALRRLFIRPLAVVLLADMAFMLFLFVEGVKSNFTNNRLAIMTLAGALMFVADIVTLGWVGMWLGLSAKQTNRAIGGSIARIMLLPWLIFIGVGMLIAFGRMTFRFNLGYEFFLGLWFGIGIVIDIVFLDWARNNLRRHFREVVTQRFDSKPTRSWWKRSSSK